MAGCTIFGHHDCPIDIQPRLRDVLIRLIEECGVDTFYIGNHGSFDAMALHVISELKSIYPHIRYITVLAYMPQKGSVADNQDYRTTILPEGIESVPRRFAIVWRNKWMLQQADYVVTYVVHTFGSAAKFAAMAKRQGKDVVNIV